MATYYLSGTDSDLSGGADFNKKLLGSAETAGTITVSLAKNATETSYAFSEAGNPNNADWNTGGVTVEVYVTTRSPDVYLNVRADRVNSSGALQESSTSPGEQNLAATGLYTFNIASMDWAAGAAGDRIRIAYIFRNNNTKSTRSVDIQTGTTDTQVITSIGVGSTGTATGTLAYKVASAPSATAALAYTVQSTDTVTAGLTYCCLLYTSPSPRDS